MVILGISCHYHESAAALIIDGKIVAAAAQERFTRVKHDARFPAYAIDFCLASARIQPQDVDYVAFYEKPLVKFERTITMSMLGYPKALPFFVEGAKNAFSEKLWIQSGIENHLGIARNRILFVPQHISHAAASYYPSPFPRAAYLTLDAVGEWSTGSWGTAKGNKLNPVMELRFPHSVGLLYSTLTSYLGFEVNDGEFKVMGMAAFGKPRYTDKIKKLYKMFSDGSIELDLSYFSFHTSNRHMYTRKFESLFENCSRFDLGASIQKCTQDIILTMMRHIYTVTKEENLVFGGGVALNSVVNGLITKKTPFKHVYIFPAAGDDGGSAGAAWYIYHHVLGHKKRYPLKDVFLGKQFNNVTIQQFLDDKKITYKKMGDSEAVRFIADELSKGKVVGWFEGRAEFGPRALGHRSIIADPRNALMKDIVNARIKFREEFRPFAPVVLSRFARKYFDISEMNLTPYMLGTFPSFPVAKKYAPAVVHDDGTSRIQIVDTRKYAGRYAKVLEAFYNITGVPVLLNTSFNLKGEPIVNSLGDAISTFERSGLDILVLENYVIVK
jgi:carbamoyltransferase